jgi:hypothetical protein
MGYTLTLTLPRPVFERLQGMAEATRQPLEQIIRQSIEGNLPPDVSDAPAEMQGELLLLQTLSVAELEQIALSQIPAESQARHLALLERNSAGELTLQERRELARLRQEADQLMVRKAYAWALLRWHGRPMPALHEIPLN